MGEPLTYSERDWPEDFPHDNGNYVCKCSICHRHFFGYKRRLVCKICSVPNDLDVCTCGDHRRDHQDGVGPCIFNENHNNGGLSHGYVRCEAFVLFQHAKEIP